MENEHGKGTVALVTIVGRSNFGNRLQNYAAVRIWEKLGYEVETLDYPMRPSLSRRAKDVVLAILGRETSDPEAGSHKERLRLFDRFNRGMHIRRLENISSIDTKDYVFFSVGSDQVWNPGVFRQRKFWYFLKFVEPEKRVAFAPSIACDSLSPEQAKDLAEGVRGFPRLSVREKRGAELIRECSGAQAEVICDPTLVLTASEWRSASSGICTPDKPFVFTYLLGGVGFEAADVLAKVADNAGIPVVALTDRQKAGEPNAGPSEFIDLIDHASHVVTDSFHAAVFASILRTPLTIVHREGGMSMFSRLDQLSQMLGIEHKVYGTADFDLSRAGDYAGVSETIERERIKFMNYLEGCINA